MENEEVIIKIKIEEDGQLADMQKQLHEVRKAKEELNKKIKAGIELSEQEKKQYADLTAQQKAITSSINEYNKKLDQEIKTAKAAENSLDKMRLSLAKLSKEYGTLDPASDKAQKLALRMNELSTKIKNAEFATGNFARNVGNYSNSILEAAKKMGVFGGAIGNVSGQLTNLGGVFGTGTALMNPYMMGITAVISGLSAFVGSVSRSEEGAKNLATSGGILKGIFKDLGDSISDAADALTKKGTLMVQLSKSISMAFGYLTGGVMGSQLAKARAELRQSIEEDAYQMTLALRQWRVEEQKLRNTIDELRAKAAQKDKYTAEERVKMLNQVAEIEKQIATKNLQYKEQEYKLEQRRAALNKNNAADNERLAQKELEYERSKGEYNRNIREINAQISEAKKAAVKNDKEQLEVLKQKTALEEINLDMLTKSLDATLMSELNGEINKGKQDLRGIKQVHIDTLKEVKTINDYIAESYSNTYEYQLAKLEEAYSQGLMTAGYYENKRAELTNQIELQRLGYISNAMGKTLSFLREGSIAYRVMASAQAIVDTYAAATAAFKPPPIGVGPLFGGILAAATIAAGLANVAKINGIRFQSGGVLQGPPHALGGIPIILRSGGYVEAEGGEIIVNKNIWKNMDFVNSISRMNAATGGVDFAHANAVSSSESARPIKVYVTERDITSMQNKVFVQNFIGNL